MKYKNNENELIEKIGVVKIDYHFYSGNDLYSDGEIENELLNIVKNNTDITEVLGEDNRWSVLCHLSPQRRNLLEWYNFEPNSTILEIGAGCGALTGLLCDHAQKVVAIELSKKRAEIIGHRYRDKANLEVIVGNLHDIQLNEKFDYITLIGVLEYAAKFTDSENPYRDFLIDIKKKLQPNGVLIIAIENKFGLKYWAGAKEDHTGKVFDSLEGYPQSRGIATFGHDELTTLLNSANFSDIEYYYPMPDYKMPTNIFSKDYLPEIGQIGACSPNYDQDRLVMFRENLVYNSLIKNDKFEFFANSFLVFCKNRG